MSERSWVWVANTETVRAGKISVLACAETVAMVAVYWSIAWIWDTHLHLLAGILVMPLMLFRSDESVALGVTWGKALTVHEEPDVFDLILRFNGVLVLLIGLAVFATHLSLLQGLLVAVILGALLLAAANQLSRILRSMSWFKNPAFIFAGFFPFILSFAVFYLLAPLIIRLTASAMNLPKGLGNATNNWRRLNSWTDSFVRPEPLPDPDQEVRAWSFGQQFGREAGFMKVSRRGQRGEAVLDLTLSTLVLSGAFISSIVFRWALKSTAWFYLPLLFLAAPYDGQSRLIWMRSFPRTVLTWVRLVLSLIGIAVALTALIVDLPTALAALQFGQAMELPVVPLSLVLVLDWSNLHPWQYASLPTAILTVILFFRLDHLARQEQAGAQVSETGFALRSMVWADRVRSVCALAWLALITPPTLRFFHCAGQLPDWAARPLAWFFQPGACQVLAI